MYEIVIDILRAVLQVGSCDRWHLASCLQALFPLFLSRFCASCTSVVARQAYYAQGPKPWLGGRSDPAGSLFLQVRGGKDKQNKTSGETTENKHKHTHTHMPLPPSPPPPQRRNNFGRVDKKRPDAIGEKKQANFRGPTRINKSWRARLFFVFIYPVCAACRCLIVCAPLYRRRGEGGREEGQRVSQFLHPLCQVNLFQQCSLSPRKKKSSSPALYGLYC